MALTLGFLASYLAGSVPTAFLAGVLFKGIDIRRHGSGNVGATNAFRLLGAPTGIAVLAIDAAKGVVPTVFIADFLMAGGINIPFFLADRNALTLRILLGISAILGHTFTVFLNFKGGKGMATTLGVLIGLSMEFPAVSLILGAEVALWIIVFVFSRIVSLASLASAVLFPLFFIAFKQPPALIIMSLALAVFIVIRHKSNIYRLLHNKELPLKLRNPS